MQLRTWPAHPLSFHCTRVAAAMHQSCNFHAPELHQSFSCTLPELHPQCASIAAALHQSCRFTVPVSQCCILHHMLHTMHGMLQSALQCRTLQMNCTFNAIFLTRTHTHNFRSWMNCHYNAIVHDRIVCSPW